MSEIAETPLVRYEVTEVQIAETKAKYSALTCDTPKGYHEVHKAIGELRTLRTSIEKRRKELKEDSLQWGRKVDSEAKKITALLLEIEEPLKEKKAIVDDAAERARKEAEAKIKAEQDRQDREAREAEEARLKAIRDAEEERIMEEGRKIAVERAKFEAEKKAEQVKREQEARIEREKRNKEIQAETERLEKERLACQKQAEEARRFLAVEQAKIDAARIKVERAEKDAFERKEREEAERRAKEEAEIANKREEERQESARKRREALLPDVEKLRKFAESVRGLKKPKVSSLEAQDVLKLAVIDLEATAVGIENALSWGIKEDLAVVGEPAF